MLWVELHYIWLKSNNMKHYFLSIGLFILVLPFYLSCSNANPPVKSRNDRIYYEYLYYQKVADRESNGNEDQFNIIWSKYDENIKSKYNLSNEAWNEIITEKLNGNDFKLTEIELKELIK